MLDWQRQQLSNLNHCFGLLAEQALRLFRWHFGMRQPVFGQFRQMHRDLLTSLRSGSNGDQQCTGLLPWQIPEHFQEIHRLHVQEIHVGQRYRSI